MAQKITLYHYTTKAGLKGITESGRIRESKQHGAHDDAVFGDGVYLTALPPSHGKIKLALNNFDGSKTFADEIIDWGKVDYYIAVDLHPDKVEKAKSNRDVYKYKGDLVFTPDMNPRGGTVTSTEVEDPVSIADLVCRALVKVA